VRAIVSLRKNSKILKPPGLLEAGAIFFKKNADVTRGNWKPAGRRKGVSGAV